MFDAGNGDSAISTELKHTNLYPVATDAVKKIIHFDVQTSLQVVTCGINRFISSKRNSLTFFCWFGRDDFLDDSLKQAEDLASGSAWCLG